MLWWTGVSRGNICSSGVSQSADTHHRPRALIELHEHTHTPAVKHITHVKSSLARTDLGALQVSC